MLVRNSPSRSDALTKWIAYYVVSVAHICNQSVESLSHESPKTVSILYALVDNVVSDVLDLIRDKRNIRGNSRTSDFNRNCTMTYRSAN